jgi:hypothetical protein
MSLADLIEIGGKVDAANQIISFYSTDITQQH